DALAESGFEAGLPSVLVDPDDPDAQSLLFWYPSVTAARDDYVRPAVKIESGAKSALDPHEHLTIRPYVSDDLPRLALSVDNVTLSLSPIDEMTEELRRDYGRMAGMIIGNAPSFEDVMESIISLETELNE